MKRHVWKLFSLALCLCLALGALSGCGSGEPSDDDIFEILEEHDLTFYAGNGIAAWYGDTDAGVRELYAEELLAMFEALGEDVEDYDAESFADAISEEFDDSTYGSIFEWACWLLDADEARYLEIYEEKNYLPSIYGGAEAALEGTWYLNEDADVWVYFDGEWEIDGSDFYGDYEGIYQYDGTTLTFYLSDDNFTEAYTGSLDSDGDLRIDGIDGWFVLNGATEETMNIPQLGGYEADLAGAWMHNSGTPYLVFDGISSAVMSGGDGELNFSYTYDGETITLFYPDTPEDTIAGRVDSDGDIQIDSIDGWFVRYSLQLEGYEADLAGRWYHSNGPSAYLEFDGVGGVHLVDGGSESSFFYNYDGERILFFDPARPGETMTGYLDSDGDIQLEGIDIDGWFERSDAD